SPSWAASLITANSASVNTEEPFDSSGHYLAIISGTLPKYHLTGTVKAGYQQNYNHELESPEYGTGHTGDWDDTQASLSYAFTSTWLDRLLLGVGGALPTSYISRQHDMIASAGPSLLAIKRVGRFDLTQGLGYKYYFFRYEMDRGYYPNSPHA